MLSTRRQSLALALSLLVLPVLLPAQASASPAAQTAATPNASCAQGDSAQPALHGLVRDVYGRLMPNARVEVSWKEQIIGQQERSERSGTAFDSTDASGRFRVCAAPAPRAVITEAGGRVRVISALTLQVSRGTLRSRPVEVAEAAAAHREMEIRIAVDSLRTMTAGTVLDSLGRPLMGARVRVEGDSAAEVTTDEEGFFQLANVPAATHQLVVRAIGYSPLLVTAASEGGADIHLGTLQLGVIPPMLDTVRVVATRETRLQREFEERRRVLPGTFIDEAEIARLPRLTGGFIASRVSRAQLIGGPGRSQMRFVFRSPGATGDTFCAPRVFVDGQDLRAQMGLDEIELYLSNAKRIEVYRAAFAPPQFTDFNGCGALVIWTQ